MKRFLKDIAITLTQFFSFNKQNEQYQWMQSILSIVPFDNLFERVSQCSFSTDLEKQIVLLCSRCIQNYGDFLGIEKMEYLFSLYRFEENINSNKHNNHFHHEKEDARAFQQPQQQQPSQQQQQQPQQQPQQPNSSIQMINQCTLLQGFLTNACPNSSSSSSSHNFFNLHQQVILHIIHYYLQQSSSTVQIAILSTIASITDDVIAQTIFSTIWNELHQITLFSLQSCTQSNSSPSELLNVALKATVRYISFTTSILDIQTLFQACLDFLPFSSTREQLRILQLFELISPSCIHSLFSEEYNNDEVEIKGIEHHNHHSSTYHRKSSIGEQVLSSFVFIVSREDRVVIQGIKAFSRWIPHLPSSSLQMVLSMIETNSHALKMVMNHTVFSFLLIVLQCVDQISHVNHTPSQSQSQSLASCSSILSHHIPFCRLILSVFDPTPIQNTNHSSYFISLMHVVRMMKNPFPCRDELCSVIRRELSLSEGMLSFLDVVISNEV